MAPSCGSGGAGRGPATGLFVTIPQFSDPTSGPETRTSPPLAGGLVTALFGDDLLEGLGDALRARSGTTLLEARANAFRARARTLVLAGFGLVMMNSPGLNGFGRRSPPFV